jgi:hypothetical protein
MFHEPSQDEWTDLRPGDIITIHFDDGSPASRHEVLSESPTEPGFYKTKLVWTSLTGSPYYNLGAVSNSRYSKRCSVERASQADGMEVI